MTATEPDLPAGNPFDALAQAFDRNTAAVVLVSERLDRGQRRVDFLLILSICEFILVCVSVITVFLGLSTADATSTLVRDFNNATGPKAQVKQAQATDQAIGRITICVENHTDRISQKNHNQPLSPIPKGCPPDSLSAAPAQH